MCGPTPLLVGGHSLSSVRKSACCNQRTSESETACAKYTYIQGWLCPPLSGVQKTALLFLLRHLLLRARAFSCRGGTAGGTELHLSFPPKERSQKLKFSYSGKPKLSFLLPLYHGGLLLPPPRRWGAGEWRGPKNSVGRKRKRGPRATRTSAFASNLKGCMVWVCGAEGTRRGEHIYSHNGASRRRLEYLQSEGG